MAGMGPAPKPADRRSRRNASTAMTRLPAEGRRGAPPPWPLQPNLRLASMLRSAIGRKGKLEAKAEMEPTAEIERQIEIIEDRIALLQDQIKATVLAELRIWFELWRTPQAVMWERLDWTRDVALYTRWQALGEGGELDAAKEARQLGDRLGLTPLALLRLRWEILAEEASVIELYPQASAGRGRLGILGLAPLLEDDDAVAT
jgi:hypothetical protein